TWKVSVCPPQRSICIFQRSGDWPMSRGERLADPGTGDRNPASSGRQAAWTEERQLAQPEPGARIGECRLEDRPARLARWSIPLFTSGVWVTAVSSRGTDTGPTADARGTLGHRRLDRQGKTGANSAGTVMVQATSRCMAPPFGSK